MENAMMLIVACGNINSLLETELKIIKMLKYTMTQGPSISDGVSMKTSVLYLFFMKEKRLVDTRVKNR